MIWLWNYPVVVFITIILTEITAPQNEVALILGSEMIGSLNIKTKMFDFKKRVLANAVREPANQDAYLKVQHFCFYVKVVYHFRPEYSYNMECVDYIFWSCSCGNYHTCSYCVHSITNSVYPSMVY